MVMRPEFYWFPLSILPFSLFRCYVSGLPVFGEYLLPMHSELGFILMPTIRKCTTESVCISLCYFSDHYLLIKFLGEDFPLLDINLN